MYVAVSSSHPVGTLAVVLPAIIAAGAALLGIMIGGHNSRNQAKESWDYAKENWRRDARLAAYQKLLPAAHELATRAGAVVVAVEAERSDDLPALREAFLESYSSLDVTAIQTRLVVVKSEAIASLLSFVEDTVNPFVNGSSPDPGVWVAVVRPGLRKVIQKLEASATEDL